MGAFPAGLRPVIAPGAPRSPAPDTVLTRMNAEGSRVQEIFRRPEGKFGFRYQAWGNYEDAGRNPHYMWTTFTVQEEKRHEEDDRLEER